MSKAPGCEALVLLSGGMDSAACCHHLISVGWSVRGLFIAYGQAAVEQERNAAQLIASYFGIPLAQMAVTGGGPFSVGEVLGRNASLIFMALTHGNIKCGGIAIGIHAGTPYYDCSPAFAGAMDLLVAEHTDARVRLLTPLLYWSKQDVFEYANMRGIPVEHTYSCEAGTDPVCGQCNSCRDRAALRC